MCCAEKGTITDALIKPMQDECLNGYQKVMPPCPGNDFLVHVAFHSIAYSNLSLATYRLDSDRPVSDLCLSRRPHNGQSIGWT